MSLGGQPVKWFEAFRCRDYRAQITRRFDTGMTFGLAGPGPGRLVIGSGRDLVVVGWRYINTPNK